MRSSGFGARALFISFFLASTTMAPLGCFSHKTSEATKSPAAKSSSSKGSASKGSSSKGSSASKESSSSSSGKSSTAGSSKSGSSGSATKPPKTSTKVAGYGSVVSSPAIEPIMFSSGAGSLASSADIQKVAEITGYLKKDSSLWILLAGYTDAVGSTSSKDSVSLARADFVKGEAEGKGADGARILTRGMGDAGAKGGSNPGDRLVEVVFYKAASGETPTVEAILASLRGEPPPAAVETATADSSSGEDDDLPEAEDDDGDSKKAAKSSKSKGSKEKREHKKMEVTGIKDLDSFFGKAQGMLDKLYTAQDAIADANASLIDALGIAEGASLEDALAELKGSAKGAITLKMEGTKPKISVKPGASPTVTKSVTALNGLVEAMGKATVALGSMPKDAQALVAEAKTIPSKAPTMAKDAGLKVTQIPKTLKMVGGNVKLVGSIPTEAKTTLGDVKSSFDLVKSTFGGG